MKTEHLKILSEALPDVLPYPFYRGREAAWLLHQQMTGPAKVSSLRRGRLGPLLARTPVNDVVAACGDGVLTPDRLLPIADPWLTFDPDTDLAMDRPSEAAFAALCAADVIPYVVTFDQWAMDREEINWRQLQISRRGGNLVVQVNFPEQFERQFAQWFGWDARRGLEYYLHPVRRDGPITMAWARLDMDPNGEDVLIEELQTDFLRRLKSWRNHLAADAGRKRKTAAKRFIDHVLERHAATWAEATLLAAIAVARTELGARRIWLHQPHSGARLKNVQHGVPPRSLYSDLPRRFGFAPTDRAPGFLYPSRSQVVSRLRRSGRPVFWFLEFPRIIGQELAA